MYMHLYLNSNRFYEGAVAVTFVYLPGVNVYLPRLRHNTGQHVSMVETCNIPKTA